MRSDSLIVIGMAPRGTTIPWSIERNGARADDEAKADWGDLFEIFVLLEPGVNRMIVGGRSLEVFYDPGDLPAPADFRPQRVHAGDLSQCDDCHDPLNMELTEQGYPGVCLSCHIIVSVNPASTEEPRDNAHFQTAIANCGVCHEAHVSSDPKLLRQDDQTLCRSCHQKRVVGDDSHPAFEEGGCSACHDAHYSGYPKILHEPLPGLCHRCHDQGASKGRIHPPTVTNRACALCHDPHGSVAGLLRSTVGELCTGCHSEVLDRGHGEELDECSACHDSHKQLGTGLLADTATAGCRECHDEVADGKTVHPALEEGCEACHDPHSEENVARARASCPGCHEMTGDEELSSLHGNLNLKPANCAKCHPPHVSDHDRLVWGKLHQPLTLGKCSSCHGGGEERSVVVENVEKRCRMCHPLEQVLQTNGVTIHEPVADGECMTCHDPHMSNQRALLRQSEADTCGECHEIASAGEGRGLHSPVETCTDCHNPHGGKRDKFLSADPPELCFDCHDDPREARGELHPALDDGCLLCHDPHAGFLPGLQRGDAPNAICLECHDDPSKGKTIAHAALTKGCSACHDPHVSENDWFLREAGNSMCRRCHELQSHHRLDGGQSAHAPGSSAFPADGNEFACTGCHEPHASDHERLFVRPKQVLCKECHEVDF